MNKNNYKTKIKMGDYPIDCDICGQTCWYSNSRVLDKYTGKGGLRVCPNDFDAIDYGLVPYTIKPEKIVPDVRKAQTSTTTGTTIPDLTTFDPLSGKNPS